MMKTIDWNQQPLQTTPHNVDIRLLSKKNDYQVQHIVLDAGQSLMPFYIPVDVTYFVLEGAPTCRIGDELWPLQENQLLDVPRYTKHGISNTGPSLCRVLAIKPLREPKNCYTTHEMGL